jgi:hypothetical protein
MFNFSYPIKLIFRKTYFLFAVHDRNLRFVKLRSKTILPTKFQMKVQPNVVKDNLFYQYFICFYYSISVFKLKETVGEIGIPDVISVFSLQIMQQKKLHFILRTAQKGNK